MDIIVCIKQSYDVQQLKFDPKTGEPMLAGAPRKMSDMDRRALEEALKIKENLGGTVKTVTVGPPESRDVVKEIYAMGADEAFVVTDLKLDKADPDLTAKIIVETIKKIGNFDLILAGAASTDDYSWQIPAKVAALLDLPFFPNAVSMTVDGGLVVESDLGDAIYKYKAPLPSVVSVSLEINEPRIPTLSAILKASRKQFTDFYLQDLGLEVVTELEVRKVVMPKVERKNVVVEATDPSKMEDGIKKILDELRKENVI
ncbi:electron transfer flavoprotein subunit beta [Archaeoglobales archaeon]|nr:MAG: electron transfer flavoprotein subunit beta [Archaeoglobales archaeon]